MDSSRAFAGLPEASAQQVQDFLSKPGRLLIDGEWVEAASGKTFETLNPATEESLGSVAHGATEDVELAGEAEIGQMFPNCELGAEPPIGCMFGLPTLMDESLFAHDRVTFQAGTHQDAVTMTLADYRKVAQPEVAYFGKHL